MRSQLLLSLVSTSGAFMLPALHVPKATPSRLSAGIGQLDDLTEIAIVTTMDVVANVVTKQIWNGTHPELEDGEEVDGQEILAFGAVDSVSISARVYLGMVLASLALDHLPFPFEVDLRGSALAVALTIWVALTCCTIKRVLFLQTVSGTTLGRVALYDRLLDFIVALLTTANVLNTLGIDVGTGLKSFFAAGGIGALVFSLASKGLAENIVGGFLVQAYSGFDEGDNIRLGDGTEGTVKSIGLTETEIVGYDNIAVKIPNSQLNQRVSNLSQVNQWQVKQTLRFRYSDLDKMEAVLESIKQEIQKACPTLITDGSKPFKAVLVSYEADHVKACVNCHFDISPDIGDYVDTRQEVVLAIARALGANGVEFALPAIVYTTNEGQQLVAEQ